MENESGDESEDLLHEVFSSPYHLEHEVNVSTHGCYILHMCGSRISNSRVTVASSDHSCAVIDIAGFKTLAELCGHTGPVSNVKFNSLDDNLIYSSSYDGTVKLWDLRLKNKCVKEFKDDTEGPQKLKPLSDFDISCNGYFVCAGTECINDDAFILFWDTRSANLLGGYWESHMDDITQVKFHPQKQNLLATGSTDGLVNTFDISKPSEEDAVVQTLNTQSSVEKVSWLSDDTLSCITHTQDLQLWHSDGASPFLQFNRDSISSSAQIKSRNDCFVVDIHETSKPDEYLLLTSSTGKCLRTLRVHEEKLKPTADLTGNKQLVRASCYDKTSEMLVTGGEAGILSVWKPQTFADKDSALELKVEYKKKTKLHRKKPY